MERAGMDAHCFYGGDRPDLPGTSNTQDRPKCHKVLTVATHIKAAV